MDYASIAFYVVAVIAYNVSPGPLMAILVSRSLGQNSKGAMALAFGYCIGDLVAVSAVIFGVGIWAASRPDLLSLGKYLGVAYLLWLAVGMWKGSAVAEASDQQKTSWFGSITAGVAICLGNPATLLVFMILLPIMAPSGFVNGGQIALALAVTFIAAVVVFFGTVLLARQLSSLVASPSSTKMVSRCSAAALALTSVWLLTA
jgi:threonine/homoserine/homoserine lactone efflux protein